MKIKKGDGEREAESKNGRIREKRNLKAEREEEEGTERTWDIFKKQC